MPIILYMIHVSLTKTRVTIYVWAMPKYIEFALVLSRFYFSGFSYNQLAVLTQCFSDGQAVYYIFLKNSQLLFRIYSEFSGSLSVNRCWVNDVHVRGL